MSRPHLLLADHDTQSLKLLEVSLRKAGFSVATSADGNDALARARAKTPAFVLAEVDLPGLDGFGLLAALRADPKTAKVPVAFLGADAAVDRKVKALEAGVVDFLSKPIYVQEIVSRVRIHLQKQEREKPAATGADEGALAELGLVELLRSLGERTGVVHVRSTAGEQAQLFVEKGRLVDAEHGGLAPEHAFFRALTFADGTWRFEAISHGRPVAIARQTPALVDEGVHRLSEWMRLSDELGGLESIHEVDFVALAFRLGDVPDEVNVVLRLLDGRRDLRQVVEESPFEDNQTLAALLYLRGEGVVRGRLDKAPVAAPVATTPIVTAPVATAPMVTAPPPVLAPAPLLAPAPAEDVPLGRDGKPLRGAALARALEARKRHEHTAPPPVIVTPPPPVVVTAPPPVIEFAPPPVIESAPPPVIESALPPVLESPPPVVESAPADASAASWAGAETTPDGPAAATEVSLASLLSGEGPAAGAHQDSRQPIPVVRFPGRRGARKERLEKESADALSVAAARGEKPVTLTDEVLPPGARPSPELVARIESGADDLPLATPAPTPALEPTPQAAPARPAAAAPAATSDDDDRELASYLADRPSRAPYAVAALVVVLIAAGVVYLIRAHPEHEAKKPAVVATAKPAPKPAPPPVATPTPPPTTEVATAPVALPSPAVLPAKVEPPKPPPPPPEPPKVEAKLEPKVEKPEPKVEAKVEKPASKTSEFDKLVAAGAKANAQSKYASAVRLLQKALKLKDDPVAERELGKALYNDDHTDDAAVALKKSTELDNKDAETYLYYGMVLFDLDKKQDAARAYRRFLVLEPPTSPRAKEIRSVLQNLER